MTELREFEDNLRATLADVANAAAEPPGLADRLVTGAAGRRPPHRVRVWLGSRWVPPTLAAAAVAVVAVVTVTTVSSIQAHRPNRPAHPTPAPDPTPSLVPTTGVASPSVVPTTSAAPTSAAATSTAPTTGASTRTSAAAPTATEIAQILTRTVETANPSTHFADPSSPVTTSDGHGGTLTAVSARRTPAADSHGSLVFFWHNDRFVGWDSNEEAMTTRTIAAAEPGTFAVTYANYAGSDAACCPSLAPVTISYRWDGTRLQPNQLVPPGVYDLNNPNAHPVTVRLLSASAPTSSSNSPPPAASGRWTDGLLVITAHSLGAVTRGMTLAQAKVAAGTSLSMIGDGIYRPTTATTTGSTVLQFSWGVTCFDAHRSTSGPGTTVATSAGVRLGDPMSQLSATYGAKAKPFSADPTWTGAGNIPAGTIVQQGDGVLLFVGSTTDGRGGTITSIRGAADAFHASSVFC